MATWTKVVTESAAATIAQATTGNAATATALATARNIAFSGGDVTGTGSFDGTANTAIDLTLADNAVTGAKIALGSDAAGDTMYYNGTDYVRLAKGTASQVLKMNSGATAPEWAADTNTGDVNQNAWSTITVPAGTTSQAADTATDTLTFTAAGGMTITGAADDSIQFSSANDNTWIALDGTTSGYVTTQGSSSTAVFLNGNGAWSTPANDNTTTTADVKTALNGTDLGGAMTIGDANDTITMGQDLVVTGDLTVSGATTTINTATLQVEDKLIKLADVTTPTVTTADGAGIQVEASATEADWPEIKWAKAKGTGNTTGAGTANGLTGWTISNMQTSNQVDVAIAVMDFKTTAGAPSNIAGGIGSFSYNSNDTELYLRTA
jgi:hypothetical protein